MKHATLQNAVLTVKYTAEKSLYKQHL